MKRKYIHGWQIYLAVTFILLGLMISMQIQTQDRLASDLSMQSTSDLSIMLKNLTDKRWQLTEEIEEAENNLATYQSAYQDDSALLNRVDGELERLQLINGTREATGSGIQINVDGNMLASDLVLVVNELWGAGAEAVSVNGHRISINSGISYQEILAETYLTVDGQLLQNPIAVTAIGNGEILEKSITMPGGIADSLSLYQIDLSVSLQDNLHMEALEKPQKLKYGHVPKDEK